LGSGRECAIVSSTTGHIENLVNLGDMLKSVVGSDFGLNVANLAKLQNNLKGSTRLCTLIELVLRYYDANALANKRWFFRPVSASFAGHTPKSRQTSKK
jgi:hypothetical protein